MHDGGVQRQPQLDGALLLANISSRMTCLRFDSPAAGFRVRWRVRGMAHHTARCEQQQKGINAVRASPPVCNHLYSGSGSKRSILYVTSKVQQESQQLSGVVAKAQLKTAQAVTHASVKNGLPDFLTGCLEAMQVPPAPTYNPCFNHYTRSPSDSAVATDEPGWMT